ncbi:MAG: hypothetical protein NWQ55_01920 [Salibacteraceae bacterium]|jgi:hypothetical protein|nr:hypothetical protein [Salibacteraceae bacterium]MDP4686287.1 hypothetical protein [Salibacteraceae bacterium]MDP4763217.1 hypothetical protein [Salibacteraceae bacterium]MDP4843623.1 hypothetical protein [Salibacteraceae bacterium]MDP4933686.1 hypothetical protein [Salibacteraceae bacterium]
MEKYDYIERQYLGFNRFGLIRRIVITIFCFVFYFVSDDAALNRDLFFYLGLFVLVLSAAALLIRHLETTVKDGKLKLVGPTTFKKVELDLKELQAVEIRPYSRFVMNRPMFNLHRKGQLRFYTHGNMCVMFKLKDGQVVKLGTQRPDALKAILEKYIPAQP